MSAAQRQDSSMPRRDFLKHSVAAAGALGVTAGVESRPTQAAPAQTPQPPSAVAPSGRPYNGPYTGEHLSRVAFPMGGLGAGMICLEGSGALSHVSLRHRPDVFNEPFVFAAVHVKGDKPVARLLEGPIPEWKYFGLPGSGNGLGRRTYGLPRFGGAEFTTRFPFAEIALSEPTVPLHAHITGWSPFVPGDADASSLPVAGLEYTFKNPTGSAIEAIFSFNAINFMASGKGPQAIQKAHKGFCLYQAEQEGEPWHAGGLIASVPGADEVRVNHAWFRGGWWDPFTLCWEDVEKGRAYDRDPVAEGGPAPGASLFVPFTVPAGGEYTVVLQLSWFVGKTALRVGNELPGKEIPEPKDTFVPWYAGRFVNVEDVAKYWREQYDTLRSASVQFRDCFYDTTLPAEVVEAVAANLTILKSPTIMRQADGRLWNWEGCNDAAGCCHGSCTHVWNYAQAIPHLFPALERTLRETEFNVSQDEKGHQVFRTALPIRPTTHDFHSAADGQLGGIMKVYREWRISGDNAWLKELWAEVSLSLDYCIDAWDPEHRGCLIEPHHNTYDIEFWGPDGMCTSFYLGALAAAVKMGQALGEDVTQYQELLTQGVAYMEKELYDGEYFIQKVQWEGLRAPSPTDVQSFHGGYSPEAIELLKKEGPKYQYGSGCLSDGVLGAWMALVCGVGEFLSREKTAGHLKSIHKYNLRADLLDHANPQRPTFAMGRDGGLLLCSWPKGGMPSLPFVYSNEVWTGIEYQVASHLMLMGLIDEGLEIVRVCRDRYDGRIRNPFNEYECGHWYARAMSSYGLLQGLSGARYDAVEKVLYLQPNLRGDFKAFLATATGYGHVGVRGGKPFVEVKAGTIDVQKIQYMART